MIERQPELEKYRNGMEPGLENPLGARALYIFEGGRDTLYRIHGTLETWSIGRAVSSGCVRLLNQDVIDLARLEPVALEDRGQRAGCEVDGMHTGERASGLAPTGGRPDDVDDDGGGHSAASSGRSCTLIAEVSGT